VGGDALKQSDGSQSQSYGPYRSAIQEFPPYISPHNLRKRYNDYQQHVNWCADRSPCFDDLKRRGIIHEFDRCAVRDSAVGVCSTCMYERRSVFKAQVFWGELGQHNCVRTCLAREERARNSLAPYGRDSVCFAQSHTEMAEDPQQHCWQYQSVGYKTKNPRRGNSSEETAKCFLTFSVGLRNNPHSFGEYELHLG
jgi:hypothetical protein